MQRKKYYDLYELYTREEMSEIAKKEGFLFVETSNGDNYEIRKSDVADFIVLEAERCGYAVDIEMYVPNYYIEEPFVSTYGYFLNRVNQSFREEIIERLIKLQTTNTKPRKVKVFDNDIFEKMTLQELGEEEVKTLQYDKFYKKYYQQPKIENEEELEAE